MNTGHRIHLSMVLVLAMAMIMALMFRHHEDTRRSYYHPSAELHEATAKDVEVAPSAPAPAITNAQILVCILTLNFKPLAEMTNEQLCWTIIIAALALGGVGNFVLDLVRTIIGKEGSDES